MRTLFVVPLAAAALIGCGETASDTASTPVRKPAPPARETIPAYKSPDMLVFRRIRYEGATTRTLVVREDGTFDVNIPNGGAGGSWFTGALTSGMQAAIRRDVARTPWGHLSRRKATLDRSGAYFILRHGGEEHVAMSAGMSKDLMPLVVRANSVLNGEGRDWYEVRHRFYIP